MADHLDAPGLMSPGMDARIDITDVYAFQKPGNASKSILMMNVNPLAPSFAVARRIQPVEPSTTDPAAATRDIAAR